MSIATPEIEKMPKKHALIMSQIGCLESLKRLLF